MGPTEGEIGVTNDEMRQMLRDQRKDLFIDMRQANQPLERRLDAIEKHLSDLNGSVVTHKIKHAEAELRFTAMQGQITAILEERRSFVRRSEDRPPDSESPVKKGEVKLVLTVIGIIVAAVTTIWKVIPAIAKLVQP
jgi:hypothetical protein